MYVPYEVSGLSRAEWEGTTPFDRLAGDFNLYNEEIFRIQSAIAAEVESSDNLERKEGLLFALRLLEKSRYR